MDRPKRKPPAPADDPTFLARLADLGEGLDSPGLENVANDAAKPPVQPRSPTPAREMAPASSEADSVEPPIAAAPFSAEARRAAFAGGARPLLDLFPPPPTTRERARGPAMTGAPPPRVLRSRFAAQLEPAAEPAPSDLPLTYEPFYGLSERPFSLSPDPRFIYHSTSYDRVTQELIDALGRGDRAMLLTGEMGTGKTTLCRSLVDQLGSRKVTSFVAGPVTSIDDLLRTVLIDFGVVSREDATRGRLATATRQELAAAVGDFAASLAPLHASAVIIIDEAQSVPADVLGPLSDLSDAGDNRRVQIVLVAQPALLSLLHRRELRAVERHVAVRCRLEPLASDELLGYVMHRLAVASTSGRVEFDDGAIAMLHATTRGVPRLVNLVCDRALTRGYEVSASVIDEPIVAAAAADLDLVPRGSDARRIARSLATGLMLLLMMLAGAAAAAWVFRSALSRAFPGFRWFVWGS